MGPFDVPKNTDTVPNAKNAEVQQTQASKGMLEEILNLRDKSSKPPAGPELSALGRIGKMSMPVGWVAGNEQQIGAGYAKEFHPKTQDTDGKTNENNDVQMVFSYRGNRLSDNASKGFRDLLESGQSADGKNKQVSVLDLQKTPLNEVLGARSSGDVFTPSFAEVQKINGEPALVVVGKYAKHDVQAKLIYIDADRNNRTALGVPVQEIAYMAPSSDFYKYSAQANKALNSIEWQR